MEDFQNYWYNTPNDTHFLRGYMIDISNEVLNIFTIELPRYFKSKSTRQQQVQMALDVADFLFNKDEQIMFLEAPVGIGKSLGVLVPSMLYSKNKKNSILYATSTINLQNQIFEQDSRVLEELNLLPSEKKIIAQGKRNYLCRSAYNKNVAFFNKNENKRISNFFRFTEHGLKSEFIERNPRFNKQKLECITMSNVSDKQCKSFTEDTHIPNKKGCAGHLHRKEYRKSKYSLVITNHAQLIQSYNNIYNKNEPIVDFDRKVIVIDEAHALKENFLNFMEHSFDLSILPDPRDIVDLEERKKYLTIRYDLRQLGKKVHRIDDGNRRAIDPKELKTFNDLYAFLKEQSDKEHNPSLNGFIDHLYRLLYTSDKTWIEFDRKLIIHYVGIKFNSKFNQMIKRLPKHSKVIFMSGTLTTSKNKAKEFERNWGLLQQNYVYKAYPNIFDLNKQAVVYVPKDISDVNDEKHIVDIKNRISKVVTLNQGGTLVLCTSNYYVDIISKTLKKDVSIPNKIISQGSSELTKITRMFSLDTDSILVGSGSFFTGFSVKGEALNKLVLTKLPYPVPGDPYIDLISEQEKSLGDKHQNYITPYMLTKLEQALGRLIRSKTDTGFIVIYDKRLLNPEHEAYKHIQHLGYQITNDWHDIEKFVLSEQSIKNKIMEKQFDLTSLLIPKIQVTKLEKMTSQSRTQMIGSGGTKKIAIKVDFLKKQKNWLKAFVATHENDTEYVVKIRYSQRQSKNIYQDAINFCYAKGISQELVLKTFPFEDEKQRKIFSRLYPTVSGPIKTQ